MTRKHMFALNRSDEGQSNSPSDRMDNSRTRRDLLTMAFGCVAAAATARIHAPAEVSPDDVFDGGTP